MARLRLSIDGAAVDDWFAVLSTEFPGAEFRLLGTQAEGDGARVILQVTAPEGERLLDRFGDNPEVQSLDVVYADERSVLVQFDTPVTRIYDALRRSKTVSRYPTILRDGRFHVTLVATRERLSEYVGELAAAGVPHRVSSLTGADGGSDLLTERQWQIVTEAVDRGYYASPRRCTVTELAAALGVQKSAASRLLHRAESRIVGEFVAAAPPPDVVGRVP